MVAATFLVQADLSGTPFGGSPTWTDITAYVLTTGAGQPISLTGPARQDEQADTTPSTCSFTLINDDGRFTPGRTSSPYYPRVLPGVRVRMSTILGSQRNYADTFDRADATLLGTSSDGSIAWVQANLGSTTVGVTGNQAAQTTLDGSQSYAIAYKDFGSADFDISWTVGTITTDPAGVVLRYVDATHFLTVKTFRFGSTNWLEVHSINGSYSTTGIPEGAGDATYAASTPAGLAAGDVIRAVGSGTSISVYHNGVLVSTITANLFATATKHGLLFQPSAATSAGRVDDFFNGGTTFNRFDGYVDAWEQSYAGPSSLVNVSCSDILARMGTFQPLQSLYMEECLKDVPLVLYPLTEPDGSTSAGDVSGNSGSSLVMTQSKYGGGSYAFAALTGIGTDDASSLLMNSTLSATDVLDQPKGYYLAGDAPPSFRSTSAWSVEAWVEPRTTSFEAMIAVVTNAAGTKSFGIGIAPDISTALHPNPAITGFYGLGDDQSLIPAAINVDDGKWHHLVVTYDGVTNSTLYVDGTSRATWGDPTVAFTPATVLIGREPGIPSHFRGGVGYVAVYQSALSAARVTAHYTAGKTGFASESTATHLARLVGYRPNTGTSIGTTSGTVGLHATAGESLQQAILETAKAEGGVVYVNGLGQVTMRPRSANYNPTSVATLDVSKDQVTADVTFRIDTQQLENDVTMSRPSGATQRVLDATSQATYGVRAVSDTLIVNSDADAFAAAAWRLTTRKDAKVRSPSLTVDLLTEPSTTFAQAMLAVRPLDTVSVTNLPSTAPATTATVQVQGWSEQIGVDVWTLTLFTTPAPPAVFSWDSDAAHGWDAAAWAW